MKTMRWLSSVRKSVRPQGTGNPRTQPVLQTERLVIRPFAPADAPRLAQLAGTRRVADTTVSIPHPYTAEQALGDIQKYNEEFQTGAGVFWAIALREAPQDLIGGVLIKGIDRPHEQGELGYWIDEAHSGRGYVTEAGHRVLDYAFNVEGLHRMCAYHMVRNAASGRVLQRLGMQQEGRLRHMVKKWGVFEDVMLWSILREEFRG
jgi:RimJ/RimL family protein N-acetyltransferase